MPENPPQVNNESDVSKKKTVKEDKSTTITEDSLFERSKELGDVFTDEEVELLEKLRTGNNPKKLEEMDKIVSGIEDRERNKNKGDQTNQDSPLAESNPDAESVLGSSSEKPEQVETVIGEKDAEDTVIEKNPVNPIIIMNELSSKRKSIEAKISEGVSKEEEKELRQKIKEISREFIKQGYNVLRDSRDVDKEIEEKETDEWRKSIEAIFGKNGDAEEKYQAREREIVETIALNKEMGKAMKVKWDKLPDYERENYGNNLAVFSQQFYEKSRREVFERTSDAGKNGIFLSKQAFCKMINEGFDPENIRDAGAIETMKHVFGGGFVDLIKSAFSRRELVALPFTDPADGRQGSRVMGFDDLQKYIFEKEKNFKKEVIKSAGDLDEKANERSEKRKKATVEQYVLDIKVREISEAIKAKQEKEKAERTEQKNKEKIEKAEKIEPEERLEILSYLRDQWNRAKKIDRAIKTGKKIEIGKGDILNPENDEERKELEKRREFLSNDIIKKAQQITGRNLREEAKKATGYVPDEKNPNTEKQKEFREWLKKEIKEIFEEQIKKIETETRKKVRIKKKVKK